jgi:maltose-binding protein MalE
VVPQSLSRANDMDIQALAALVVQKYKKAGGYIEMSDQQLYKSVYKCLDQIYRKHFKIAQDTIKLEEASGIFPNEAKYEALYGAVESIVFDAANDLAATDKAYL